MKEESKILQKIGKENPFTVPEGYFEQFHRDLIARLPESPQSTLSLEPTENCLPNDRQSQADHSSKPSRTIWLRPSFYWNIAASVAILFVVSFSIYLYTRNSPSTIASSQPSGNQNEYDNLELEKIVEGCYLDDYDLYQLVAGAE